MPWGHWYLIYKDLCTLLLLIIANQCQHEQMKTRLSESEIKKRKMLHFSSSILMRLTHTGSGRGVVAHPLPLLLGIQKLQISLKSCRKKILGTPSMTHFATTCSCFKQRWPGCRFGCSGSVQGPRIPVLGCRHDRTLGQGPHYSSSSSYRHGEQCEWAKEVRFISFILGRIWAVPAHATRVAKKRTCL